MAALIVPPRCGVSLEPPCVWEFGGCAEGARASPRLHCATEDVRALRGEIAEWTTGISLGVKGQDSRRMEDRWRMEGREERERVRARRKVGDMRARARTPSQRRLRRGAYNERQSIHTVSVIIDHRDEPAFKC